ncbi:MAG TPA: hypothetical protein PLM25_04740 [Limnochordia bacterium]|nr:hypothetical protein [Limnochordia bacterium]
MVWSLMAAVLSYLAVPVLLPIYRQQVVKNYLGELVPAGLGWAFLLPAVLVMLFSSGNSTYSLLLSLVLLFFAALGAVDDSFGNTGPKGWRGHFAASGLSTGALKALGGGACALAAAQIWSQGWLDLAVSAGLVALGANLLNLLDLRPGRAGKAFFLFSLPLHWAAREPLPLQVLSLSLLGYLPWDLRRKAMMGDTGANALGAALGYCLARELSLALKIGLLAVLAALNFLSEWVSFSDLIEGSRLLRFLDKLGR